MAPGKRNSHLSPPVRGVLALPCLGASLAESDPPASGGSTARARGRRHFRETPYATFVAPSAYRSWLWQAVSRDAPQHVHTFASIPSAGPPIFTNRCSLHREPHLSPGAHSMRSVSPARSSCSRTTTTSTGRSTGTSQPVGPIRIECRCAGSLSVGGPASRPQPRISACRPSLRRAGPLAAGRIAPLASCASRESHRSSSCRAGRPDRGSSPMIRGERPPSKPVTLN